MKKRLIITVTAIVLATIIIIGALWFLLSPSDNAADDNTMDISRLALAGETIISEDFSDVTGGSLPEGWDKTHPYIFLNSADKSTSLATEGGNNSHVCVRRTSAGHWLGFCGRNGANILTLPNLGTEDHIFSFNLCFESFKTPFGVAVGLPENYKEADSAIIFQLSGIDMDDSEEGEALVPCFSLYRRELKGGDDAYTGTVTDRVDIPVAELVPDIVVINDRDSGAGTIPSDQVLNIKVYHYDNSFYFFCNDVLIASIADSGKAPATRVGFFSDTSGREVKVTDVQISRLLLAADIKDTLYSAAPLLYETFENTENGQLPEKWKLHNGQWPENGDKGAAEVADKQLKISSKGGAAAVILPQLNFSDTLTSVSFEITDTNGKIGIVDNISDPLTSSRGGTFAVLNLGNNSFSHYNLQSGKESGRKDYTADDIPGLDIKKGDKVTFKVYSVDGTSYFFINDIFISYLEQSGTGTAKHFAGIYTEDADGVPVTAVTVEAVTELGVTDNAIVSSGDIILGDGNVGMKFDAEIHKTDIIYKGLTEGELSHDLPLEFGIVIAPHESRTPSLITDETEGAVLLKAEDVTEASSKITFTATLPEVNKADLNKFFSVRAFMAVENGGKLTYFYGEPAVYSPAVLASGIYLDQTDSVKAMLDSVFEGHSNYVGKYEESLTFALFSDFHYKAMMYSTSIADLQAIFDRAAGANAAFMLSAGDFCNDFLGSPELTNAFLNNKYGMPSYNIYGNHELESADNSMQVVTPLLTNDRNVVWGTENGKIGDGSVGYYYFENSGFRIVCTDTNYSYNPTTGEWEHNTTASYGPPSGNTQSNSLGPTQLAWLEAVLTDAAHNGIPCIVVGHDSFAGRFRSSSSDAASIREIYSRVNAIRRGTVLMSINGHIHTNNIAVVDDVLYLDMNTTRNGVWKGTGSVHYTEEHTFDYVEYDISGNPISSRKASLGELSMGDNTWFFEDPLSAIVTVSEYGTITIEGMESSWAYGVVPDNTKDDQVPMVSSGTWEMVK